MPWPKTTAYAFGMCSNACPRKQPAHLGPACALITWLAGVYMQEQDATLVHGLRNTQLLLYALP